ncbi:hypothetical protein [Clostridium sp.]|uniref:hypothetical protein n=1 Tax=Clostridium sp. TaxID=1506 RepID=UPI003F2FBB2D
MIVTFISEAMGQTSVTSNVTASAITMALKYTMKIGVMDTQAKFNRLERMLLEKDFVENELKNISNANIDTFLRELQYGSDQKANDFTLNILNGRLDLLPSTRQNNGEIFVNTISDRIGSLVESVNRYYDVTLIDMHHTNLMYQKYLLDSSDVIVVNINQNIEVLDKTFNSPKLKDYEDKMVYVIGNYEEKSKYNIKNIKRRYGVKNVIAAVPHNAQFMDSCNDSKVIDFFLKNIKATKKDENYFFMDQVDNLVKTILTHKNININLAYKQVG